MPPASTSSSSIRTERGGACVQLAIEPLQRRLADTSANITTALNRRKVVDTGIPTLSPRSPAPTPPKQPPKPLRTDPFGGGDRDLTPVAQRILDALAELHQLGVSRPDRVQVAFLAGYSNLGSKGFVNALGTLSSGGLIVYPEPGKVSLTDAGSEFAVFPERPRSAQDLQQRVIDLLGGASGRILRPLLESYPDPLERDQLAEQAGYTNLGSKGFVNALRRLRSLGFVDYPSRGLVAAQPVLFSQGA